MTKWHAQNINIFDETVNYFRKYIAVNYTNDDVLITVFNNIPESFKPQSTGYWDEIIHKSNSYVPEVEDHMRCPEEKYIQQLVQAIKYFVMNDELILDSFDNTHLTNLLLFIMIYDLRAIFIVWIDLLNNIENNNDPDSVYSLDEVADDACKIAYTEMENIKNKIIQYNNKFLFSENYIYIRSIFKSLACIIKFWQGIKRIPAIKDFDSAFKCIEYSHDIFKNNYFKYGYQLINILNECRVKMKDLHNSIITDSCESFEQLTKGLNELHNTINQYREEISDTDEATDLLSLNKNSQARKSVLARNPLSKSSNYLDVPKLVLNDRTNKSPRLLSMVNKIISPRWDSDNKNEKLIKSADKLSRKNRNNE